MKQKIYLFLRSYLIVFAGITLVKMIGCVIYGFSENTILTRIIELPYIACVVVSFVVTVIFMILIFYPKRKK